MTDNSSGNLSIDFLVGFTIFMVAFIWVATLVPNLFIGVSAHGIDFDAVAYRTGVILSEDPGATIPTVLTPWERQPDSGKANIERFGLAISKETPNILSQIKVNRFFDQTAFTYPDDYRPRIIFGDYPYRFNVSLQEVGGSKPQYVGDVLPDNYGFVRREVKVKHYSNATIDTSDFTKFRQYNNDASGNVTFHDFSIMINTTRLLQENITNPVTNPNFRDAYQIDPRWDWINITLQDFDKKPPVNAWVGGNYFEANLTKITFGQTRYGYSGLFPLPAGSVPHTNFMYVDGDFSTPVNPPIDLATNTGSKNITFAFPPGFFSGADATGSIYINMTFGVWTQDPDLGAPFPSSKGMQYLNSSRSGPWDYNYNATEVTQPELRDAVLEVAVW